MAAAPVQAQAPKLGLVSMTREERDGFVERLRVEVLSVEGAAEAFGRALDPEALLGR